MAYMRQTPYATVHLTHEARDRLRSVTLTLQADVGRRLTLSEVVLAALREPEERLSDRLRSKSD